MKEYDIILVSAEPFVDHPFSGVALIKRVLEDKGFEVGIIDNPNIKSDADFKRLGKPRLLFGVSSGSIDSMLFNYTPMKKKREESEFTRASYMMPDRAVTVYCNIIRRLFKDSKIVLGGIESSLRRFAHYDYWENRIRKSILLDTRADILVFGYGELQTSEIAKRLKENRPIDNIDGTCIVSKDIPKDFTELPSFEDVEKDKKKFCEMQNMLDTEKKLAQKCGNRYVLQNKAMQYTTKDLDYIYGLDYSRKIPPNHPELEMVRFSVLTHRGCFGGCNFCAISAHSGKKVVSRSQESIIDEIKKMTKLPGFKGKIELSGATQNMYGMDCKQSSICRNNCIVCTKLDVSHNRIIELLRAARKVKGVEEVIIRSGIRYDLALNSPEYLREIIKHHIRDTLMIAPEHVDKEVLRLMNKGEDARRFISLFRKICEEEGKDLDLSYYTIVGHPGCTLENSKELHKFIKSHKNANFLQVFTPTPMTVSTCMYYTGMEPRTLKQVYVPYTYSEKKKQKNIAMGEKPATRKGSEHDY